MYYNTILISIVILHATTVNSYDVNDTDSEKAPSINIDHLKPPTSAPTIPKSYLKKLCENKKKQCQNLDSSCLECRVLGQQQGDIPSCRYGERITYECKVKDDYKNFCKGPNEGISVDGLCQYCYQVPHYNQTCLGISNCSIYTPPPDDLVRTICWPNPQVVCLGRRSFYRKVKCNYTNGYKWSTALFLSITLGGFGGDRFYLGSWREGLGKLFSFGGLGVWTIIDVILIAVGYVGPEDGSLYM